MEKVLIIEDSKTFSGLLKACIEDGTSFECVQAFDYAQAESYLKDHASEIFCATVDINLPDCPVGGAIDLVAEYPGIAPIVLTGQLSRSLREDIIQRRVADYVLKNGQHNIDYVVSHINRLYRNADIKVLVVDDSNIARKQMRRLLEVQRFQVCEASSAEIALEVLKEHSDIRMTLIDCHMEGMGGMELATKIRDDLANDTMAIIGVSGVGGQDVSAQFIKSGANDFLLKPFQPEEFNCRVNQNVSMIEQIQAHKQANEMKNQLLGMAAHDIRGPIGVIQGAARIIKAKELDKAKQGQLLDMILGTSKKMLQLLNDLLDVSVIESGKVSVEATEQGLANLIHDRVEFYRSIAERKQISLSESLDRLPPIKYDESRIEQVVDNLLSNAIKYSPLNSKVEVILVEDEDWQRFCIIDEGPGIDKDNESKLFGLFQTLGNTTTGGESSTGLGLAICKNMVEAHNGKIGYEKRDTGGSCFYVQLPSATSSLSL